MFGLEIAEVSSLFLNEDVGKMYYIICLCLSVSPALSTPLCCD